MKVFKEGDILFYSEYNGTEISRYADQVGIIKRFGNSLEVNWLFCTMDNAKTFQRCNEFEKLKVYDDFQNNFSVVEVRRSDLTPGFVGELSMNRKEEKDSKKKETTFTDYLKIVSPEDQFGIRSDLKATKAWKHLDKLVDRYIEFKSK